MKSILKGNVCNFLRNQLRGNIRGPSYHVRGLAFCRNLIRCSTVRNSYETRNMNGCCFVEQLRPDTRAVNLKRAKEESEAADKLRNLSPPEQKQLKIIQMEYDVEKSLGKLVPETITDQMWLKLIFECSSPLARGKLHNFWFKLEKDIEAENEKRALRQEKHLKRKGELAELRHLEPFRNSMFFFIREQTMNMHYYNNLAYSMQYGIPVIIDFSYEEGMTNQAIVSLARQVHLCYAANKIAKNPFHLNFCNINPDSAIWESLQMFLPGMENIPMTITRKSYLDIFPPERLVYLSPNAPTMLSKFNPDDIYIIGGLVDTSNIKPVSIAKAKREHIRSAKLPLDVYMKWIMGNKTLTLDVVFKILLELQQSQDWTRALTHIPARKAMLISDRSSIMSKNINIL